MGSLPDGRKIYFAGSIRGGRGDAALYDRLIRSLKRFGTVLTEHVGDAAVLKAEQGMSEEVIFDRDMDWLAAADCVVAEVTTPSLGVGFEIARAQALGKPVLCLYRPGQGKSLSAMIAGNRGLSVCPYATPEEAEGLMASFVENATS